MDDLVKTTAALGAVANVVLHHHEGFNGMGYPGQLKGEESPVWFRIVAIEEQGGKYDPCLRTKFAALIVASAHRAPGA